MYRYQARLALISLAAVAKASESSCAASSCIAEPGVALLQNRDHRSMKIKRVSGITQDGAFVGRCNSYSQGVSLTEDGYKLVKASCCFDAMSAFIARLAEEELGFTICGSGFAPGLALWHSCEGEGASRTFDDLSNAIEDHSKVRCTALSAAGEKCTERPADCPDYSGVQKPPGCVCSSSKFVDLDFSGKVVNNNLDGAGPNFGDAAEQGIRFEKIGQAPDGTGTLKDFDLVVTADSPYEPGDASINGKYKDAFGQISLRKGFSVDLLFSFYRTGTTDAGVTLADFAFTIFDLDGKIKSDPSLTRTSDGFEGARASDFAGYITEDDSYLKVATMSTTKQTRFYNNKGINVGNAKDSYKDPMQLDSDQRKAAVMLFFKNVSSFQVTYAVNPTVGNLDDKKTVSMLFAGKSALSDHCAA